MDTINGLALCAGIGGLELGIGLALGQRYRTVCYVEKEARAAATLVARMEDQTVHKAPIWDCLETFDGSAWCGSVDIVSAGFPCQPWSVSGLQQGVEDSRWLWPAVFQAIRHIQPTIAFLENVEGFLNGGLQCVLGDAASVGLHAEWGVFSAAGVGGSQRRRRVFVLVYDASRRSEWVGWQPGEPDASLASSVGDSELGALFPPFPANASAWRSETSRSTGITPILQRDVRGVDNGYASRVERYRNLGNAVVPLVAATAFKSLMERIA